MKQEKESFKKRFVAVCGILLGLIYIANPGSGVFELIPDNVPFIGNLDEVGAVLLILKGLQVLGFNIFKNKKNNT